MSAYAAPIRDMMFTLREVVGLTRLTAVPGWEGVTADVVEQALGEAGKLAGEVLAPLNRPGDQQGSVLENGVVRTPPGFKEAYRQYIAGGWNGVPFDTDHGGQGLPWTVATAIQEMWQGANLSWGLCPLLNQGAVELLLAHGSAEQKRLYVDKLVSGEWTGTMNLTEPQAGSDVGALRTRAVRAGDHYRITGQKIFITYGEHDFTPNIVHMVLARLPDAPAGSRGISLFLVPKFMVNPDGSLGARNDLRCVSLEHKLGIKASPTAVMAFGDGGGAVGYLIGEENRGLECMFTMMNNARLNVGLQGVALAERAYQQARDYARTRVQGRAMNGGGGAPVAIIRHPDVRRMLMTMRASTEAMRALTYYAMAALDLAAHHPDAQERQRQQALIDLLTPVVKAWCTDLAVEVASIGVQVHGGMGFIEETGAAQHYRDVRITPIYEGTNGIQANDLVFRKLGRDGGAAARAFIAEVAATEAALAAASGDDAAKVAGGLAAARRALEDATGWMTAALAAEAESAAAGAAPYLRLFGTVAGGFVMARAATAAIQALDGSGADAGFLRAKVTTARFFAEHVLPQAPALAEQVQRGASSVLALAEDLY